jgi:ribonuclease P protein component
MARLPKRAFNRLAIAGGHFLFKTFEDMSDEAHFSAEQLSTRPASRLSRPDGNSRRAGRDSRSPLTRSQEAVGLIKINARKDFLAANSAKRAANSGFVLLVRPREDSDQTMRIGITVTKKIGNAVVRNRMKRRFRALAREILPEFGLSGADHVMIGRASGVERDFAMLRQDLTRALEKIAR